MRALILCEGKTDAILLSYLLCKQSGWDYFRNNKLWRIGENDLNDESANWYKRNNDYLLICSVGGKDNFGNYFSENLYEPILQTPQEQNIDKLIYVVDKDGDSVEALTDKIINDLKPFDIHIAVNEWRENKFTDSFGMEQSIEILPVIVPEDQEGALENVLLEAISETEYDRNIVDKCVGFVEGIKEDAREYIPSPRMELKAKLSVVFAIRSPQKVFSLIDELIKSVNWESYSNIRRLFEKILNI